MSGTYSITYRVNKILNMVNKENNQILPGLGGKKSIDMIEEFIHYKVRNQKRFEYDKDEN